MFQTLLDLLFPRRSLRGEDGAWITDDERRQMQLSPVLLPEAELRRRGMPHLDAVLSAGEYDRSPLLRKAILTFKYRRVKALGEELGTFMANAIDGRLMPKGTPVLCPVPLHWTRGFERGFNQALVLAEALGAKRGWPVAELLLRIRPTGHQARRTKPERLTALRNAFRMQRATAVPACVVLVDDLCTTGATLEECATVLKAGGVRRVYAIVAALG